MVKRILSTINKDIKIIENKIFFNEDKLKSINDKRIKEARKLKTEIKEQILKLNNFNDEKKNYIIFKKVKYNQYHKQYEQNKRTKKQQKIILDKEIDSLRNINIDESIKLKLNEEIKNKKIKPIITKYNRRNIYHVKSALGQFFKDIEITNIISEEQLIENLNLELQKEFKILKSPKYDIKFYMSIKFKVFSKRLDAEFPLYRNSEINIINNFNDIYNSIYHQFKEILNDLEITLRESDLTLLGYYSSTLHISKVKRAFVGSYIKTPNFLANKRAIVNIKNNDNQCINYCLVANKYYCEIKNKDKNQTYNYKKYLDEIIKPENITYPIDINKDIPEYEELNNIKIIIWYYNEEIKNEDSRIEQIYYNKENQNKNVIYLLLLKDGDKKHLTWIKNINFLFPDKTHHGKNYICFNCQISRFYKESDLIIHKELCLKNESVQVSLPNNYNNILKFKNEGHKFKHPFSIFADFESTLMPMNEKLGDNSTLYQKHIANSFGLYYKCIHDEYSEKPYLYANEHEDLVIKNFIEKIEEYTIKSYKLSIQNRDINNIINVNYKKHCESLNCSNCDIIYDKSNPDNIKCRHHDHITGEYISDLCFKCNLLFKIEKFIPVYIHNLKGYDSHLFIRAITKYGYQTENQNIKCIPNNEQKYISFSKKIKVGTYFNEKDNKEHNVFYEIRFLDTLGFMNSSIASLTKNLKDSCDEKNIKKIFMNTSKYIKNNNELDLLTQKGIYPYDYITNFDVLNESKLPKMKKFYSKLTNEKCNMNDYLRAMKVWKTFKCNKLMDYHMIYLKSDVLLLADIWENFKNVCYDTYKLDACYYYTSPSLSFDSFLLYSKAEIELLTDMDKVLFIENGIRGGISMISHRFAEANNKHMKNYNEKELDKHLTYMDANNLYGWAMMQTLPYRKFKWNNDIWDNKKIMKISENDNLGYTFEVDIKYPEKLHKIHNQYPFFPENMAIKKNNLNEWQQKDYKESKIKKLCNTLNDKKKYIVHYKYLQLALEQGLEITKVYRVLEYEQKKIMKSYIELNTNMRKNAKNDFEKDFFKLMNNSIYGKTLENVRNRIEFKLVSNERQASNLTNKPTFKSRTIFSEDLVGIHMKKTKVILNKPIFLGQTILDLSKYLMYDFHYNFMIKKVKPENLELLFTDTDSLAYVIKNVDWYKIILENLDIFDTSNFPKDHELYSNKNKKIPGLPKLEEMDNIIIGFAGMRSKLYSYMYDNLEEIKKCKGIKNNVVKQHIQYEHYKNTLFNREIKTITQNGFLTKKHQIYSVSQNKIALSYNDDKKYVSDNNINTYSFGYIGEKI